MRATSTLLCALLLAGCMSGKQRYRLHREKIRATAKQQRTYSPIEFKGLTTITAQDGVTVTVPMEQLKFKDIPDDFKTGADLAKWLGAMGLAGYAIHSAAGDTASVTNNNSTGGTP